MRPSWAADTARRIGVHGEIKFTTARVGMTLHVPCEGEKPPHLVDVLVAPGLHPNGVAKKMLGMGWTLGTKLKCPGCSGRKKREGSLRGGQNRWAGMTPEQRQEEMRKVTEARLSKSKGESEMSANVSRISEAKPTPSDAAKRAHRLVMQALEDYYDEGAKSYRPGYSDKSIAEETGASIDHVKATREQYFGPLGEPSELAALRQELGEAKSVIIEIRDRADEAMREQAKKVEGIAARLDRLCVKNGWAA